MFLIYNFSHTWKRRVSKRLVTQLQKVADVLGLSQKENYKCVICFVDYDESWGEYGGGAAWWGQDGSKIDIEIAKPELTPDQFILWLTAHEMRHAAQDLNSMFNRKCDKDLIKSLLKAEGITKEDYKFNRKYHDAYPWEVDADAFGDEVSRMFGKGFNGRRWWDDVIEKGLSKNPKEYEL